MKWLQQLNRIIRVQALGWTFLADSSAGFGMAEENYDFEHAWLLFKTKDHPKAWEYVLPHASAGDSNAQCMMGFLCEFGGSRDVEESERWLRKAAEQNNALACITSAHCCLGRASPMKQRNAIGKQWNSASSWPRHWRGDKAR